VIWKGRSQRERNSLIGECFELIQLCQHLGIGGDLPLLSPDIGKLHDAQLVNDKQSRALTERDQFTLHIILAIDLEGIVHEGGKGHRVLLEEAFGIHHCIGGDHDDLGVSFPELLYVLAQLLQMLAAEWSEKSPQKNEDNVLLSQKLIG